MLLTYTKKTKVSNYIGLGGVQELEDMVYYDVKYLERFLT